MIWKKIKSWVANEVKDWDRVTYLVLAIDLIVIGFIIGSMIYSIIIEPDVVFYTRLKQ